MRATLTAFLIVTVAWAAAAQPYTSQPNGFFTVNEIRGCAPLTINLNAPSCDGTVGCDVDYDGDNVFESVILNSTHTYTSPGVYTIRLVRGSQSDNLQIEVFENVQPTIQVSNCGGNRVMLSVLDNSYDQYLIDYDNNGTTDATITSNSTNQHTYGSSGPQTISVRGRNLNAADNCNSILETVNVIQTIPPPVISRLEVLNDSEIRLDFNGLPNVQYRLEMGTNSATAFQQIKTLFKKNIDTVGNLSADNMIYCFRVGAFDPCTNTTAYSNVICSTDIEVTVLNNENRITMNTIATAVPLTSRQLEITPTNTGTSITVANASNPYSDNNVNCGQEYCYQATLVYSNNTRSISQPKCAVAVSNDIPSTITDISTVVTEAGVDISWETDPAFTPDEFSVYTASDGINTLLGKTADTEISDDTYSIDDPSCYRIGYVDVCGNQSATSNEACPIVLSAELTPANDIVISWSPYNGWGNGVARYIIEKYDVNGVLLETIDGGTATSYTDTNTDLFNQVYVYIIRAEANDAGISASISNRAVVIKDPNLFYPTSFTPNGDALNDIFNVYGQYISEFQMDIFNRWGELMFTTTDLDEGWDGKFKGTAMPEGTYTFVARITDYAGRNFKKSGSVLLLQKK